VLSQFTDEQDRATLADYLSAPGCRVAGRLDYDSEGLLLLTDDGLLQQNIANPKNKLWKTYLVQVEGDVTVDAVAQLEHGLALKDGTTLPARASRTIEPALWTRNPPIRSRKTVTDSWLKLSIREGRNRQVRRMTAAVGFPTLRLIRASIGDWSLEDLQPGQYRELTVNTPTHGKRTARQRQSAPRRRS
jgi:23S rRNA pseudouridine2457 synthase